MPASHPDYNALARSLPGQVFDMGNLRRLYLKEVVGVGAFGAICKGEESVAGQYTNMNLAVKCMYRTKSSSDRFVVREKTLHPQVAHPNVVRVHYVFELDNLVFIVMDYYPEGDLFKAIVDRQEFVGQDTKLRRAFVQVAEGVRACHRQGIFHRDIKPENILVHTYDNGDLHLSLADFGLATTDECSNEFGVGSSYYMSLECGVGDHRDRRNAYSSRSNDVWSLGVLLINFACGRNPWVRAHPNEETFSAFTRDPDYLLSILPISLQLNELLKSIFHRDPSKRISLDDLIDRVWEIPRFTLNYQELCYAPAVVRNAAGPLFRVREKQAKEPQPTSYRSFVLAESVASPYQSTFAESHSSPLESSYDYSEDLIEDVGSPEGTVYEEDISEHLPHPHRTFSDPGARQSIHYTSAIRPLTPLDGSSRLPSTPSHMYQQSYSYANQVVLGPPFEELLTPGNLTPASDLASHPSTPDDYDFMQLGEAAIASTRATEMLLQGSRGCGLGLIGHPDFDAPTKSSHIRLYPESSPGSFHIHSHRS